MSSEKCRVCIRAEAYEDTSLCVDCGLALDYLLRHYSVEELPEVCERMKHMQIYLQRQLRRNLPSTFIAAALVLEEKGRIYEM